MRRWHTWLSGYQNVLLSREPATLLEVTEDSIFQKPPGPKLVIRGLGEQVAPMVTNLLCAESCRYLLLRDWEANRCLLQLGLLLFLHCQHTVKGKMNRCRNQISCVFILPFPLASSVPEDKLLNLTKLHGPYRVLRKIHIKCLVQSTMHREPLINISFL